MTSSSGILPPGLENLSTDRFTVEKKDTGLDQADFLKLMITQLENQDPTNPMESGDFISQMAQFGTVNGITELTASFETLASSMQSSQALQASTLVGRAVLVEANTLVLGETGTTPITVDLTNTASDLKFSITDASGQIVREFSVGQTDAGLKQFEWDGFTNTGERAEPGNYFVSSEAVIGGTTLALKTLIQAQVESVSLSRDGSAPVLNLAELGAIELSNVYQVF